MRRRVLLDTGPLVAFLKPQDQWHNWVTAELATIEQPLLICEAVVSEACFLLRRTYVEEETVVQQPQQALREAYRVTAGERIILFTYNPALIVNFWLTHYFPSLITDVQSTFMPIPRLMTELQTVTSNLVQVRAFPLPPDLSDSFAAVGWARPELYLDPSIRNGISAFAKLNAAELMVGLSQLKQDLNTGAWDDSYGQLRQQTQCDVGYRFIYTEAVP